MLQHKGEIVEKAVRESGITITRLTNKMGKSRRWLYQIFERPNVPMDYIIEIGKIIHHDFSKDIRELRVYKQSATPPVIDEHEIEFIGERAKATYWKNKYVSLLEKYNELLANQKDN
ncbi:MAG: hypothetical protein QNK23_07680 [Crocinitomicaceae bacterium]|nr:hypothetical protein [Crocinitomicaceae bacterium]